MYILFSKMNLDCICLSLCFSSLFLLRISWFFLGTENQLSADLALSLFACIDEGIVNFRKLIITQQFLLIIVIITIAD